MANTPTHVCYRGKSGYETGLPSLPFLTHFGHPRDLRTVGPDVATRSIPRRLPLDSGRARRAYRCKRLIIPYKGSLHAGLIPAVHIISNP